MVQVFWSLGRKGRQALEGGGPPKPSYWDSSGGLWPGLYVSYLSTGRGMPESAGTRLVAKRPLEGGRCQDSKVLTGPWIWSIASQGHHMCHDCTGNLWLAKWKFYSLVIFSKIILYSKQDQKASRWNLTHSSDIFNLRTLPFLIYVINKIFSQLFLQERLEV